MNNIQKRFLAFLLGCIGVRLLFVLIANKLDLQYLPIMGYIAVLPAIGFLYIFFTGSRKSGLEVQGGKIWWNFLRPVHSLFYLVFAYLAINKKRESWIPLFIDVILGLIAFLNYHFSEGNFSKVFDF